MSQWSVGIKWYRAAREHRQTYKVWGCLGLLLIMISRPVALRYTLVDLLPDKWITPMPLSWWCLLVGGYGYWIGTAHGCARTFDSCLAQLERGEAEAE